MRGRLEEMLGKHAVRSIQIGTFHSICMKYLQKESGKGSLLDEFGCLTLAEEVLREYEPGPSERKLTARKLVQKVSAVKNSLDTNAALQREDLPQKLYASYCAALEQYGAMDYDDILLEALAQGQSSRQPMESFTYLLVDEFQDINPIQYALLKAWNRAGREIFVIGDPDQAIYGFRGSDSLCFSRFAEDYAGAKEIHLRKNYRSTPEILHCALPIIQKQHRDAAFSALEPTQNNGDLPRLFLPSDPFSEAICIAKEINRMVGGVDMLSAHSGSGREESVHSFADIAILYRTHRQAELLEKSLLTEGIPYTVTGRDRLLAEPVVRGTLGFFRSLLHPLDCVSLKTCLQLVWGCSEALSWKTANAFSEISLSSEPSITDTKREEFLENLPAELRAEGGVRVWASLALSYLPRLLRESPASLLETWAEETGYTGSAPMDQLLGIAALHGNLANFLDTIALGKKVIFPEAPAAAIIPTPFPMTMHGSKGPQFPVVFLCGIQKGRIPLESPGYKTDPEEERRLFYVGITRAKEELILTAPEEPSPFLSDIPEGLLIKVFNPASRKQTFEDPMEQISLF